MILKPFTLQWVIAEKDAGKQLKVFLREQEISRASLTDIKFGGGDILVNGSTVTVRYSLKKGDILEVIFPNEEPSSGIIAENISLNIVYEDEYVLVIDKSPYMSTIPSRDHPAGTLANAILGYYNRQNILSTVHIVTRLDKDTSGLVLVAKHRHIHHLLSKCQRSNEVKRRYQALVHGNVRQDRGIIDIPIGRKDASIIEREVRGDGQQAITHFEVLKRYGNYTYVTLKLETGRTHQIRVHMASIGHPLLGDDLYGGSRQLIGRQALHSYELSFWHPFLNEELIFRSSLPEDIKKLVK